MAFTVELLPELADNYIFLVSDADVVLERLKAKDLYLALILNTHHHKDHVGGDGYSAVFSG